jgi:hypothetical protein
MAEGDGTIYDEFLLEMAKGSYNLLTDNLKMGLMGAGHTPAQATHGQWSDVSADEATGTGYSAGGKAMTATATSVRLVLNTTAHSLKFDVADVTWTSLTLATADNPPTYAILYDDTHASDFLICYWELGSTSTNGSNYKLTINASGVLTIS